MKLQYKITLFVFAILLVIGLIGAAVMVYLHRQNSIAYFEESALTVAMALQGSLEDDMIQGEREHIQDEVVSISSGTLINEIMILSRTQEIFASGEVSEIGQIINDKDIAQVLATGEMITRIEKKYGRTEYCVIHPLINKPACQACHGSETKVLGVIEIGIDRTPLDAQTREQTLLLALIGGITFVAVGGMLTVMLRITVVNPLAKLAASARRIAEGNLSARADVTGKGEVSMLASNFNEMAERVEKNARALEDSKADLEQRVKKRTNELEQVSQQLRQRDKERGDLLGKIISTQEEERQRVARELHDQTGQSLTLLMIGLKTLETASRHDIQQRITDMRQLTAQTLDEVHNLALELRPSSLDDLGLIAVLKQYTEEYAEKFGVNTEFQAIGFSQRRLSPETEIAIYRIVQEALTNVAKHAKAKKASVLLEVRDSSVVAIVEDDGKGFNIKQHSDLTSFKNQLGLYGMYERAELIGGKVTIESNPGRGTTVFMEVPLSRNES